MIWVRLLLFFLLICPPLLRAEESYESRLVTAINVQRSKAGLTTLTRDERLMKIAAEWAQTMAGKKKMFHRDTLRPFLKEYDWKVMNENISASPSQVPPEDVVARWMNSSGHRRNILQDDITLVGVGTASAPTGEFYAVFNGSFPWPKAKDSD